MCSERATFGSSKVLIVIVFLYLNSRKLNETEQALIGTWVELDEDGTYDEESTLYYMQSNRRGRMVVPGGLFTEEKSSEFEYFWSADTQNVYIEYFADAPVTEIIDRSRSNEIDFSMLILSLQRDRLVLKDDYVLEDLVFKRISRIPLPLKQFSKCH